MPDLLPNPKIRNRIGERYGRLTVRQYGGTDNKHNSKWICQCDCGQERNVLTIGLRKGTSQSCGCLRNELTSRRRLLEPVKHGLWGTKLYWVWNMMNQRCKNQRYRFFYNYGGRGITVCNEWSNSKIFMDWALNNGYRPGLQIDRIDNDGPYSPGNCRFVTRSENNKNRRSKLRIRQDREAQCQTIS